MTDRSKSPRKRRLQLNAEDFAPPTDMHQAPDEPRLDEAWVRYYGGEKLGGIKRLTSIDDEFLESDELQSPTPPETPITSATGDITENQRQNSPPSIQEPDPPPVMTQEASPENRAQSSVAPIMDYRRPEKPRTTRVTPRPHAVQTKSGQSPSIDLSDDSKLVELPEPNSEVSRSPADAALDIPFFESWSRRWSPWLRRGGSIKVCEAFFQLTHAQGKSECFTSNSEIMKRSGLSRAQCIRNIHYLIEMGFLDELSEVNNREAKGTYYRFNLVPKSLAGQ